MSSLMLTRKSLGSYWVYMPCYMSLFMESLLSMKNKRKRVFLEEFKLTLLSTKVFNSFNKVLMKLRRPPETWKRRFLILPNASFNAGLHILQVYLTFRNVQHKYMRVRSLPQGKRIRCIEELRLLWACADFEKNSLLPQH